MPNCGSVTPNGVEFLNWSQVDQNTDPDVPPK